MESDKEQRAILKRIASMNPWADNDGTGEEYCFFCLKEVNYKREIRAGKQEWTLHEEDCPWMRAWKEVQYERE